jgi:hypothetical protein
LGDGPPGFRRGFTCPAVLRIHSGGESDVEYRALTLSRGPFQAASSICSLGNSDGVSYNPRRQAFWFGLIPFRSPLLRKSRLLSLPPGTKMFQFPGSAFSHPMDSGVDPFPLRKGGSPIRKSSDHSSLTAPRSISVFVPSFIGS